MMEKLPSTSVKGRFDGSFVTRGERANRYNFRQMSRPPGIIWRGERGEIEERGWGVDVMTEVVHICYKYISN